MKKQVRSFASLFGIGLLATSMTLFQACSSDGKKESRTEDAMERTGDAAAADTKDAAEDAREGLNEAGDKAEAAGDEAAADFRRERDEAVTNMRNNGVSLMPDRRNAGRYQASGRQSQS